MAIYTVDLNWRKKFNLEIQAWNKIFFQLHFDLNYFLSLTYKFDILVSSANCRRQYKFWIYKICLKGVLVAFRGSDMKFSRLVLKYFVLKIWTKISWSDVFLFSFVIKKVFLSRFEHIQCDFFQILEISENLNRGFQKDEIQKCKLSN